MEPKRRRDLIDSIRGSGMRVVRMMYEGDCRYGLANDDTVTLISDEPFAAWEPEGVVPLSHAELLAPVVPTKVVCVGLNYRGHVDEMGHEMPDEPVIFLKPSTAVIGPQTPIVMPKGAGRVDYEAELGVVIGRRTHRAGAREAEANILGYTCGNDVTARDLQTLDGQWTRAKGFDTFCPVGPWVETDVDPRDLLVECYVNGKRTQSARTSEMIFGVPDLVSFISNVMTLVPGDIVLTGTPSGIGPIATGDTVEVRIEGVGSLSNVVA